MCKMPPPPLFFFPLRNLLSHSVHPEYYRWQPLRNKLAAYSRRGYENGLTGYKITNGECPIVAWSQHNLHMIKQFICILLWALNVLIFHTFVVERMCSEKWLQSAASFQSLCRGPVIANWKARFECHKILSFCKNYALWCYLFKLERMCEITKNFMASYVHGSDYVWWQTILAHIG